LSRFVIEKGGSKLMKRFSVALATIGVGLMLVSSACHEEGPAEKAGKKLDETMENTGDAMKNAGESMGEKLEDAGEKMKDATDR
jgi:hypothetical protein